MNSAKTPAATDGFRGGLGVALDLVLETAKPALGNTAGDGARHGPCGMLGGEDGVPHDYRLISEGRPPRPLRTRRSASSFVPAIASKSAHPAAAAGDRRRSDRRKRERMTANRGRRKRGHDRAKIPTTFTIGIDVGGTYTDLVAIDEHGKTVFAKSPSTPSDQSVGVTAGLEELARRLNLTRSKMLG